ncbi:hypothetical protein NC652_034187 [Populus alba x Populus x berolinensis]|nr:hypothetical protein NC652_034187 [Populus alba x Populus x berolinensis]
MSQATIAENRAGFIQTFFKQVKTRFGFMVVPHLFTSRTAHHEGSHDQKENSKGSGEPKFQKQNPFTTHDHQEPV